MSKFPPVFSHVFILTSNTYEQDTRSTSHGLLTKPSCNTSKYVTNAFAASGIILKIKIIWFPDLISFVIV